MRERLFKPFQSTKPAGMGIGVYESQQYVAGLGGSIRIESRERAGTRVELRLPLAQPAPAPDATHAEQQVA
jgi:signal transduction histidine kinase